MIHTTHSDIAASRRRFLKTGLALGVAGLVGVPALSGTATAAPATTTQYIVSDGTATWFSLSSLVPAQGPSARLYDTADAWQWQSSSNYPMGCSAKWFSVDRSSLVSAVMTVECQKMGADPYPREFHWDINGDYSGFTNRTMCAPDSSITSTEVDVTAELVDGVNYLRFTPMVARLGDTLNFRYALKIVSRPQNTAPVAAFTMPARSYVGDIVAFDASGSSDPDGDVLSYDWSFGGSGVMPTHVFTTPGSHDVTLTVTDPSGALASVTRTLLVEQPTKEVLKARAKAEKEAEKAEKEADKDARKDAKKAEKYAKKARKHAAKAEKYAGTDAKKSQKHAAKAEKYAELARKYAGTN